MAKRSVFSQIIEWLKSTADWITEKLGDPAIAGSLREDLGLKPGGEIDDATRARFAAFSKDLDPDKESFAETVREISEVATALKDFGEALKNDEQTGWDVAYLLGRLALVDSVRTRAPSVYAVGKLALFISDDFGQFEEFDPALVTQLFRGELDGPKAGEAALQRWMSLSPIGITLLEKLLQGKLGVAEENLAFYYGWDPDPASNTARADLISSRLLTLIVQGGEDSPDPPVGGFTPQMSLTLAGLPAADGGPAVLASFGGGIDITQRLGSGSYTLSVNTAGALDFMVPLGSETLDFDVGGDPTGTVALEYLRDGGAPELRIDGPGGTRVEVDRLRWALDMSAAGASFRFRLEKARLVIALGEDGDDFLSTLGGKLEIDFSLGVVADTDGGFRLEGGTGAKASLPVGTTFFDVFTVHDLDIELKPGRGEGFALELSGGFGLHLGPFAATVGGMGLALDVEIGDGNLGFMDVDPRFLPPNRIGLALDVGIVKGGGYLDIDRDRGEYTGIFELKVGTLSVKVLGILSTQMPDGADGWSLLLLVFVTQPQQVGAGFVVNGAGGLIGLQHGVSIPELEAGLRTGVMDDILFPDDPVANAQRIINRLRKVYPVVPRALTFGLMFDVGWGVKSLIQLRMGVVAQFDNVLGSGPGDIQFSRLVVIGRLLAQAPPKEAGPALLRLVVDFLGYYDTGLKRLGFQARLRDGSYLGKPLKLNLSGMVVVQAQFGESRSFVLAAGGFHPRFKDVPAGVPAKIDRLSVSFKIKIVNVKLEAYFAVAPGAVQVGAQVFAKAKIGPVSFEGWLGFDAIFFDNPRFHFEVDLKAGVKVKFKGRTLSSVTLKMTLTGPGQWRAKGSIKFSVLFWDVNKKFDKTAGTKLAAALNLVTDVALLLAARVREPANWVAQLPAGGEAAVTIGKISGVAGVLAHPTGSLSFSQEVVPLGLKLARFGTTRVRGPDKFDVQRVTLGGAEVDTPVPVRAPFAMSQFLNLTEEEKLTNPSFENARSGVSIGMDSYTVSAHQVAASLEYETHYLPSDDGRGRLVRAQLASNFVDVDVLAWQAGLGAAGQSPLRQAELVRSGIGPQLLVAEAPLAAADPDTMAANESVLVGDAGSLPAFAEQLDVVSSGTVKLVEAFELAGSAP